MSTVVTILMSDLVPLKERGMWQGIINLIWAAGSGMGAPLGGILADTIGWRLAFIAQAPLAAAAFLSASLVLHLPETAKESNWSAKLHRVDFLGALILISATSLLLVGLDHGANVAWNDTVTIVTLSIAAPLAAAFVYVETSVSAEPFAPGRVVFGRRMIGAFLCNFFSFSGWYSVLFYLPLYFQGAEAISATQAGLRLMPGVAASVCGSLGSGLIMRRTGRYFALTVAAYSLMTLGAAGIAFFSGPPVHVNGAVLAALSVGGLGAGTGVTTTLIALISNASPEDQAVATACSYLFRSLGSVLGLAAISTMLQQQLKVKLAQRLAGNGADGADIEKIVIRIRESLDEIKTLPPHMALIVRRTYGESIRECFAVIAVFVSLALVSSCESIHPSPSRVSL